MDHSRSPSRCLLRQPLRSAIPAVSSNGWANAAITLDVCGWGRAFATRYTYGVGSVGTGGADGAILLKNWGLRGFRAADSLWPLRPGVKSMMGERGVQQDALFYEFSLECHVPATHLAAPKDLSNAAPSRR